MVARVEPREVQQTFTPSLETLRAAQQRQAMAQAQEAALKQQSARSAELRKSNLAGRGQMDFGQVSVAGGLADLLRGHRADRAEDAALEKMQGMYGDLNAGANEAALLAQQNYINTKQTEKDRYEKGLALAREKERIRVEERKADAAAKLEAERLKAVAAKAAMDKPITMINPDTGDRITGYPTKAGMTDREGNVLDVSQMVPYKDYIARKKAEADAAGTNLKPTGSERKTAIEANRLRGVIGELQELRSGFDETELAELDSPKMQAAMDLLPASGARLAEEAYYDSDNVRTYMTRIARLESKLSQLASGLAVTGYEMTDRKNWSPNAPGISDSERQLRLDNINRDLMGETTAFNDYYPNYKVDVGGADNEDQAEKRTLVKRQVNQAKGLQRLTYSDGSVEEKPL